MTNARGQIPRKRRLVYVIRIWVRLGVKDYKLLGSFFPKDRPSAGARPAQQQPSQASLPLSIRGALSPRSW